MTPLFLIGGLLAGAYVLTKKPKSISSSTSTKTDCGCGLKPFWKLSKDCTKILGVQDWVLKPELIKADNNKINTFINGNKKDFNIWKATEEILIKRYGEKCWQASEEIKNFLFVSQFADIARVLYLYDHIDTWNYDQLIFGDLWHYLQNKKLLVPYDGSILVNDTTPDQAIVEEVLQATKIYPKIFEKDSKALAIPLYFGAYIRNTPEKIFIYDYNIAPQKSFERWNRYINIIEQAKTIHKGNKK